MQADKREPYTLYHCGRALPELMFRDNLPHEKRQTVGHRDVGSGEALAPLRMDEVLQRARQCESLIRLAHTRSVSAAAPFAEVLRYVVRCLVWARGPRNR
jgi:hypothetical protein